MEVDIDYISKVGMKAYLDELVVRYNRPEFIPDDPISIPHAYCELGKDVRDIEIAGLFAALFAWGSRPTIIRKTMELLERMDHEPLAFALHHSDRDLAKLEGFCHRTFCTTDAVYFMQFLGRVYRQHASLEELFYHPDGVEAGLNQFRQAFISGDDYPARTGKHVSSPASGSACKRLCMYLRWMVRKDEAGVDLGLWSRISMSDLVMPCDVHVLRSANKLNMILSSSPSNWSTAMTLTRLMRTYDVNDPIKYDFALFGLSEELSRKTKPQRS